MPWRYIPRITPGFNTCKPQSEAPLLAIIALALVPQNRPLGRFLSVLNQYLGVLRNLQNTNDNTKAVTVSELVQQGRRTYGDKSQARNCFGLVSCKVLHIVIEPSVLLCIPSKTGAGRFLSSSHPLSTLGDEGTWRFGPITTNVMTVKTLQKVV